MTIPATVPVTITPEAADFMENQELEQTLEQMLEYIRHQVPGLSAIVVKKEIDYTGEGLGLTLEAHRLPVSDPLSDTTDRDWAVWKRQHFSPEIAGQFCLISYYTDENGHGW